MSSNWWDPHPHEGYMNLEKVETNQPWFETYRIHDWLYCIYEGGIFDEPVMYLVIGEDRACVIDGGSGIGRLDKLIEELTDKPYFLLLTHTHNDHIGGCKHFDDIWVYDDWMSWERAAKGYSKAKMHEIIEDGYVIKDYPPDFVVDEYGAGPFTVTHWYKDGDVVDLGDRKLEVIHTPGHSTNSVCLLDREARYLFTGDHYYTGGVSTYLPGGDHDDFITSSEKLVKMIGDYDCLMPAHHQPLVEKDEMVMMQDAAVAIKEGKAKNWTERMAVADDYNKPVRRYQFKRFSLTVRDPL